MAVGRVGVKTFLKLVDSRFRRFSWPQKNYSLLAVTKASYVDIIKTSNKSHDSLSIFFLRTDLVSAQTVFSFLSHIRS